MECSAPQCDLPETSLDYPDCRELLAHFDGFVYLCSRDYRILYLNDPLIRRVGEGRLGQKCYRVMHDLEAPCPWCVNDRVFEGEVVNWQIKSPKDQRFYNVINIPLKNSRGEIVGKQALIRDITDQRKAEEALSAEMNKVNAIIAAMGDGIAAMDTDLRVLYQNSIHQQRQGRHLGELCYRALHRRQDPCPECQLLKCFKDGRIHRREVQADTDIGLVHMEITASPLRDHNGTIVGGVEVVRDITERKRIEEALRKSEEDLRLLLQSAGEGIYAIDLEGRCTICNPAAARMLGYDSPDELLGRNMHSLIQHIRPESAHRVEDSRIRRTLREGSSCIVEDEVFWRKDGGCVPVEYHAHPILREGEIIGAVVLFSDISRRLGAEHQLKEKESRLNFLAYYDPLTKLPNRVLFHDRLQHALRQAHSSGKKVVLLLLDLDRFKNINDSLGHDLGDRLLCDVASRLRGNVREADTVARFGGDEFLIILENLEDPGRAATVAGEIQAKLGQPLCIGEHEFSLSSSIGISVYPDDAQDAEGLLKGADVAMYKAKEIGRNNYQFYRPEMNAHFHEMLILETRLRKALALEQFEIHYQPQFDLVSGKPIGVEALLRWRLPEIGLVSPAQFIPLAEETGLIIPIGEWVLNEACRQARIWQASGISLPVAVNISGVQFKQPDFVDTVDRALRETGLEARWLELEITESIIMGHVESTICTLTDLKMRGVQLSVDDFGTGYSSLGYLKRFPIDKLKIDQSFIRDVQSDANDAAIVSSIIALGRSMEMDVIAEGVERKEHVDFLVSRQCYSGQGFLLGKPVPAPELKELFDTGFSRCRPVKTVTT